jgi:trk system potassium uptake protein TrkA
MKQDFIVIGLGVFGREVAVQLYKNGKHVLAVDSNAQTIDKIKDHVTGAVLASITDEDALRELDPAKFETVILGLGSNFENMVLGIAHLKKLGAKHIIARANTEIQQQILLKIGADEVMLPERQSADRLADRLARPNIADMLAIDEEVHLAEIKVHGRFADRTLRDLDLRRKYNITALILKRNGEKTRVITDPELRLKENDCLVVLGDKEDIARTFS